MRLFSLVQWQLWTNALEFDKLAKRVRTPPRAAFGDAVVDGYVHAARWEQFEYDRRATDWELIRGFECY